MDIAAGGVTITLTSTNNQACTASSSSFYLAITPSPVVDAGIDQVICGDGEGASLNATTTVATGGVWTTSGSGTFIPSNTALNATYIPSQQDRKNGTVTLSLASSGNGSCIPVTDKMDITILSSPEIDPMMPKYVLEGQTVTLNPVVRGKNLTYAWSPATYLNLPTTKNPVVTGVEDQEYILTVTGEGNCTATEKVMVKVLRPIIIPNTITPNGDGINDTWVIKEIEKYPSARMKIFNRYGSELYRTDNYNTPWDGTYNGQPLPVATYYYILDVSSPVYSKVFSGYITIVK
jgi:gliding motility-associated-like protein